MRREHALSQKDALKSMRHFRLFLWSYELPIVPFLCVVGQQYTLVLVFYILYKSAFLRKQIRGAGSSMFI